MTATQFYLVSLTNGVQIVTDRDPKDFDSNILQYVQFARYQRRSYCATKEELSRAKGTDYMKPDGWIWLRLDCIVCIEPLGSMEVRR
jgi:hypothetical protein